MTVQQLELQHKEHVFDDYTFRYGDGQKEPWVIELSEVYKERGAVWSMVSVYACVGEEPIDPPIIGPSRVNIIRESRGGGLIDIIDRLTDQYPQFAWEQMFQQAKLLTLRSIEHTLKPVSLAEHVGDNDGPPFLTRPYLAGNGLTILYGDGGTGKSNLALTLGLEIASGQRIVSSFVPHDPAAVLYIDYEDAHDTHADRVMAIAQAHSIPAPNLARLHRTSLLDILAVHTKELVKYVTDNDIGFIILDSLGMACGGDITASEPVIRMGQAIRALGVPTLGIHHNNKAGLPYGSVYIRNMARLMWQAQPRQSPLGDPFDYIYLENEKANNVRRQPVQYLKVRFTNEDHQVTEIRFEATDVHGFPEADKPPAEGGGGLGGTILVLLQADPGVKHTVKEIHDEIGGSEQSVRNQLNKLADTGKCQKAKSGNENIYWVADAPLDIADLIENDNPDPY